ncbi:acyl-CoA dehydrogenase [Actinomadura sp. LD22]|uniref:Acyl-CoA dehydrogenase n=1 Tax=Actinomadura physcomitrii TaxID=2650748 RepID=A0A6I4MGQ9_9ACTN|nr:acyl-CoA dehydrogenase family protein [Actinomadura physcomitrii]MWA02911.1 acyl-CoA dehydrogenase [Actinomadura physcomitrii]
MAGNSRVDLLDTEAMIPEEERAMQAVVRRFADETLRPVVAGHFEAGTFPVELATEFGELGLLGMHLDGYGCAGSSSLAYGLACLELEAVDSGFRSFVSVQGSLAMFSIHHFGSEEQKQEWLPRMARGEAIGCFGLTEPDHGSDPGSMRTRARRDGDDWIINGSKMWITNAPVADVATVWARTDDGVRGFLVPKGTPGFEVQEIKQKLSLRASITGALFLEDVRVPSAAMLPSAKGLRGPLSCLSEARYGIVFGSVGAARDCLETTLAYARQREQFGKSLAAFQLTQEKLADMSLELSKAMLVALRLAELKDGAGVEPAQISVGKLNNVREALQIARTCRTILGGAGITLDYPPLRHANNLESVLTYEGTSEIHTLAVGQALTGVSAYR